MGGDPGPHSRHLWCTMGREVGTVQVSEAGPPQAGKVLASLEQLCQVCWATVATAKPWGSNQLTQVVSGRFCSGEMCQGPLGLCATQVRMGTPASLLLSWSSPRDGPIAGDTLVSLCPPWCTGSANHHPAPSPGNQAWPVVAASGCCDSCILQS